MLVMLIFHVSNSSYSCIQDGRSIFIELFSREYFRTLNEQSVIDNEGQVITLNQMHTPSEII